MSCDVCATAQTAGLSDCPGAAVPLGSLVSFSLVGFSSITSAPGTFCSGNIGSSGIVSGITALNVGIGSAIHVQDAASVQAHTDLMTAYNNVDSRWLAESATPLPPELGGLTLTAGLYGAEFAIVISMSPLTLDAQGVCDSIFVLRTVGSFAMSAGAQIILAGGAKAANVYWAVAGSFSMGASAQAKGFFLVQGAITLGAGACVRACV
jgi:hypothetical protein